MMWERQQVGWRTPGTTIMKETTIFLETQFIALKINQQTGNYT